MPITDETVVNLKAKLERRTTQLRTVSEQLSRFQQLHRSEASEVVGLSGQLESVREERSRAMKDLNSLKV